MVHFSIILYFKFLAILATVLLWGGLLVNGGVKALVLAAWHGRISDKIPLRRTYSGFPPLDYIISLLVAFFFYGTNDHDRAYQLFLIDGYSALQPAFVWLYVEAARSGAKPTWVERPIVFGILWQCFGGAIALPLYYITHISWATTGGCRRIRDTSQAFAIPWSFCFGAVLPAIVGMGTKWFGPGTRSSDTHQLILGLWQLDPIWVSWIQMGVSMVYTVICSPNHQNSTGRSEKSNHYWTLITYLFAAVFSGAGHLYTIWQTIWDGSQQFGFADLYIPWPFSSLSGGQDDILVYGPWLFLQYDFIIISLSSLSWAYYLLKFNTPLHNTLSSQMLVLTLLLGAILVGPATTVSLALLYRETKLPGPSKN
ncbi:hypothetical protein F5Y04DRAFT_239392 [Hypomontagnella monticulosa]|nr:hypothetical protein F5Y04DRAFT_239392 [Hypomontagnella monticulosa]